MEFLKINAALMFVIILLSRKVRFGSSVKGSLSNDYPSSSTATLQYNPSTSYEEEFPSTSYGEKFIYISYYPSEEQVICREEITAVFEEEHVIRSYVEHAIRHFTLTDNLPVYLRKYYRTFFPHMSIGEIKTVRVHCLQYKLSAKENDECRKSINFFLLIGLDGQPYNPDYFNRQSQEMKDITIRPRILLYNALHYLTAFLAMNTHNNYIIDYFESIIENFDLTLEHKKCTKEINDVFNENEDIRDYIKYAILHFTLDKPPKGYLLKYYLTFYNYILLDDVKPVKKYCASEHPLNTDRRIIDYCKESINKFLLQRPDKSYYNPLYYNTIKQETIIDNERKETFKDLDIEPNIILYNALYYLTKKLARKTLEFYPLRYISVLSTNFGVNPRPENAEHFQKPYNYCILAAKKKKQDQESQSSGINLNDPSAIAE